VGSAVAVLSFRSVTSFRYVLVGVVVLERSSSNSLFFVSRITYRCAVLLFSSSIIYVSAGALVLIGASFSRFVSLEADGELTRTTAS
jgi:hypothetical protein